MKEGVEYILCSAIWYKELPLIKGEVLIPKGMSPYNVDKGIVFCGWRHANCLYQKVAITGLPDSKSGEHEQGFITSKNIFVTREEAAEIAFKAGQIDEPKKYLFSEDVW